MKADKGNRSSLEGISHPLSLRMRSDTLALAVILAVFLFMTVVSWQRWCNPVIDSGREMNQPLRLLRGEMLYSEVYHLYGPLSPYINAGLYKIFGAHLHTLYVSGWLAALLLIGMFYWIARTLMAPLEATLALVFIIVLCVFKQSGNYISPYSYAAVHGTLFDVATVICLLRYVQTDAARYAVLAGCSTGLAFACKSEFGIAAGITSLVVITLRRLLVRDGRMGDIVRFLLPATMIAGASYLIIFLYVPWKLVARDSYMLMHNIPPELVYFNKARLGLDEPVRALEEMAMAFLVLLGVGLLLALISLYWTQGRKAAADEALCERYKSRIYSAFLIVSVGLALGLWFERIPLDRSPYRATPLILAGLVLWLVWRWRKAWAGWQALDSRYWIVLVLTVHSVMILSRVILRIPSGGAYGAYFLPTPIILLSYLALESFPSVLSRIPPAVITARRLTQALFIVGTIPLIGVTAYRYHQEPYYTLETPRGTLKVPREVGQAFRATLDFIAQNTQPEEPIFGAPEGTSLNFLADRRNPQRYEILTPGFLTPEAEHTVIRRLQDSKTRYIFILNRATYEFGPRAFGIDYCTILMNWIEDHYHLSHIFGENHSPRAKIGDRKFFIKVYERNIDGLAEP